MKCDQVYCSSYLRCTPSTKHHIQFECGIRVLTSQYQILKEKGISQRNFVFWEKQPLSSLFMLIVLMHKDGFGVTNLVGRNSLNSSM